MSNEIEIRAIVEDKLNIQGRLLAMGFSRQELVEQLDIVLDRPDASLFKSGQKIRIRIEGERAELTYKGHFQGDASASRRTEVDVSFNKDDAQSMITLFEALGYPLLFSVPKSRELFVKDGISATFDEWPIIGCLLELEGPELAIKELAMKIAPDVEFKGYRLKELFSNKCALTGKSLSEMQSEYESNTGNSLGRLELLIN